MFLLYGLLFLPNTISCLSKNQRQELNEMKEKIEYLHQEVEKQQNEKQLLENDSNTVERYAREKYFMKKDNEDIYMIDTLTKPEK
ncbi:MAG: septum formation initiator [Bacteroidetes bacterium OLB11]|nr:MAG: septum formation initiator [Bacteroidetes bacterium OLB11]